LSQSTAEVGPGVRGVRVAFLIVAWAFLITILAQVFFAGLALFDSGTFWATHVSFGYYIFLPALVLLILVFFGRFPRRMIGVTGLAFALYVLQTILPNLQTSAPVVAAYHPVNALILFGLVGMLAWRSRAFVPTPLGTAKAMGAGALQAAKP
jgi:mercuric ion transport protein